MDNKINNENVVNMHPEGTQTEDEMRVEEMTEQEFKEYLFNSFTSDMLELYRKKNHDYGDAFSESFDEFGIESAIIRLGDKYRRLRNIVIYDLDPKVNEAVEDTLMDLANYAVMTLVELEMRR
jgi:hypothetical protein